MSSLTNFRAATRALRFKAVHYTPIQEMVYTDAHPEVVQWTSYFQARCAEQGIFEKFAALHPRRSRAKAEMVGTQWYRFSSFMPWFLCRAASQVGDNHRRHYVIQTAFEELGERSESSIHPEMFKQAAIAGGVREAAFTELADLRQVAKALDYLRAALIEMKDDATVLGILLGLEIPAVENIETVFGSLAYSPVAAKVLGKHRFFRLHRCIETEHVRLTISNFLRFCQSPEEKKRFIAGFDQGVHFWSLFWTAVSAQLREGRK